MKVSRWLMVPCAGLFVASLGACTPSGERVREDIAAKSDCSLTGFKVTGTPHKDKQGYVHYAFSGTLDCAKSRSFHSRKYPEATPVKGEAEMLSSWMGLRHELTRYEFEAD